METSDTINHTTDAVDPADVYQSATVISANALALTSPGARTITSLLLPAGDWDVTWAGCFVTDAAANITRTHASISLATNTANNAPGTFAQTVFPAFLPGVAGMTQTVPNLRLSLAVPTTVYGIVLAIFSAGTVSGFGALSARRVR